VRYSFPRLRIDQIMDFCWKFLTPLALVLLIVTAILDKALTGTNASTRLFAHLGANIIIALATVQILRTYARRERRRVGEDRPTAAPQMAGVKESVGQE
jgi:predicted permease